MNSGMDSLPEGVLEGISPAILLGDLLREGGPHCLGPRHETLTSPPQAPQGMRCVVVWNWVGVGPPLRGDAGLQRKIHAISGAERQG